jgi:hypothetical protein
MNALPQVTLIFAGDRTDLLGRCASQEWISGVNFCVRNVWLGVRRPIPGPKTLKSEWLPYVPLASKFSHSAHAAQLRVPYGSHNKQRLFP